MIRMYSLIEIKYGDKNLYYAGKHNKVISQVGNPFSAQHYISRSNAEKSAEKIRSMLTSDIEVSVVDVDHLGNIH